MRSVKASGQKLDASHKEPSNTKEVRFPPEESSAFRLGRMSKARPAEAGQACDHAALVLKTPSLLKALTMLLATAFKVGQIASKAGAAASVTT